MFLYKYGGAAVLRKPTHRGKKDGDFPFLIWAPCLPLSIPCLVAGGTHKSLVWRRCKNFVPTGPSLSWLQAPPRIVSKSERKKVRVSEPTPALPSWSASVPEEVLAEPGRGTYGRRAGGAGRERGLCVYLWNEGMQERCPEDLERNISWAIYVIRCA